MLLLNGKPVPFFKFPGGEIQVKLPLIEEFERKLIWKPTCSDDILLLIMTVNALNGQGYWDIELDCLYLPYARQDRICNPGEANSLEMICGILDGLNLTIIRFYDVHNESVTFRFFKYTNVLNLEVCDIFNHYKILDNFDSKTTLLLAPDVGARKRVADICCNNPDFYWINLEKTRNSETGIVSYDEIPEIDASIILVIDDICDGGSTFLRLAEKIPDKTLYLYVTHGIFSHGLDELSKYYTHIYCHHVLDDSKCQSNEFLTILRPQLCGLILS